jgi:hypothetical protein
MKKVMLWLIPACLFFGVGLMGAMPTVNFKDGWDGLNPDQVKRLRDGQVVILDKDLSQGAQLQRFIQAAMILNQPIDQAWALFHDTQRQEQYLPRLYKVTTVEDHPTWNKEDFFVKLSFINLSYRVQHNFEPEKYYFYWTLDPGYKNDLKHLEGYWKLFKIDDKHTLARYGTIVNTSDLIPRSIQEFLTKQDLPESMDAVKKYIDSNGTFAKPGYKKG